MVALGIYLSGAMILSFWLNKLGVETQLLFLIDAIMLTVGFGGIIYIIWLLLHH